jgi:hypothetical protein
MPNNLTEPAEHRRCTATANRHGGRCKRSAIAGGRVCPAHGGRAPAVKRRAAERVALARAVELIGNDVTADPAQLLLRAVRAAAGLLGAAEAVVRADDADAADLYQLGETALLAGRLARLALDAGVEERLVRQSERNGEVVGAILVRVLEGLDLGPQTTAKAFNLVRGELDHGHLTLGELDTEIRRIADELRESDFADAMRGFPDKLARGITAGFAVLDLSADDQEKVVQAVESFLEHEREQMAQLAEDAKSAPPEPARPWWADSPRYNRNGNGAGWR